MSNKEDIDWDDFYEHLIDRLYDGVNIRPVGNIIIKGIKQLQEKINALRKEVDRFSNVCVEKYYQKDAELSELKDSLVQTKIQIIDNTFEINQLKEKYYSDVKICKCQFPCKKAEAFDKIKEIIKEYYKFNTSCFVYFSAIESIVKQHEEENHD